METRKPACHMNSHLVLITSSLRSTTHAHLLTTELHLAPDLAQTTTIQTLTLMINPRLKLRTAYELFPKFKATSCNLVRQLLLSLCTLTSLTTRAVSTNTPLEVLWEAMQSKWSVGVKKTELLTGSLQTRGTNLGATMATSRSYEDATNAELKDKLVLVKLKLIS